MLGWKRFAFRRWAFIGLIVGTATVRVFADTSRNTTALALRAEYSSDQLERMNLEQLNAVHEIYERGNHTFRNEVLGRVDNEVMNYGVVDFLGGFQMVETFQALRVGLYGEIKRAERGFGDAKMFGTFLNNILRVASSNPAHEFEELKELFKEANGRLKNNPEYIYLLALFEDALEQIATRHWHMASFEVLMGNFRSTSIDDRIRLERMEAHMQKHLLGQPEVLRKLMDLEWRDALYGHQREKPNVVYLMGMPGTGKDQAAEVFSDALLLTPGANRDHLFRVPVMKNNAAVWQLLGSPTGYIGSQAMPPFIAYLVLHSGGKYKIEVAKDDKGQPTYSVHLNSDYHGQTLPGYYPPSTAIVFLNEFHNWSRDVKDQLIKQALEKGHFQINNPNGGLAEISVPVRFIIASNEGIGAITSREANGTRHGQALGYDQLLKKWENVQNNKSLLKSYILQSNGSRNQSVGEAGPGISEELLSRIPEGNILLLRPLAPEALQGIIRQELDKVAERLQNANGLLGHLQIEFPEEFVRFLQEYDYVAEENARPIFGRIENLLSQTLTDAVRADKIDRNPPRLVAGIRVNPDKTRSLTFTVKYNDGEERTVSQLIAYTEKDRPNLPITDARIDQLSGLEQELRSVVFGIDPILQRLAQQIITLENDMGSGADRAVNVVMLTGLTSTGKTETAKQLARKVNRSNDPLITFDFSSIQTMHDFQTRIIGLKDGYGNPIPSDFMKEYDRANGRLIVAFDELANVRDRDVLKMLYDFFREPTVSTFSDGKPRAMGGVTVIITGNAGQEDYNSVPADIPMEVQMRAWASIYDRLNGSPGLQRRILEKYYPEPLLARVGANNIFFVPPHSYQSLRQLAQLKLELALKRLGDNANRRGWEVLFPDVTEYSRFIDIVIAEGFNLRDQGASIDSFINNEFEKPLSSLLLRSKVPSGARAVVKFHSASANHIESKPGSIRYDVHVDNSETPLELNLRRPFVEEPKMPNEVDKIVTAYHEAAHSIVRQAAFKDAYAQNKITIIPGVGLINDHWLYYLGVASSTQKRDISSTREWAVRQIAILAAGEMAERLVTKGRNHSSGKSNDASRTAAFARYAILVGGLSDSWIGHAVPHGMSIDAFVASFSDAQKDRLEKEEDQLIAEAREFALSALEANFESALIPLANELAETGEMEDEALKVFYDKTPIVDPSTLSRITRTVARIKSNVRSFNAKPKEKVNFELLDSIPRPRYVADIDKLAEADKRAQFQKVALPDKLPLGTNAAYMKMMSEDAIESLSPQCAELLEAI